MGGREGGGSRFDSGECGSGLEINGRYTGSRVSGGKGVISTRFGIQIREAEIDRSSRNAGCKWTPLSGKAGERKGDGSLRGPLNEEEGINPSRGNSTKIVDAEEEYILGREGAWDRRGQGFQ